MSTQTVDLKQFSNKQKKAASDLLGVPTAGMNAIYYYVRGAAHVPTQRCRLWSAPVAQKELVWCLGGDPENPIDIELLAADLAMFDYWKGCWEKTTNPDTGEVEYVQTERWLTRHRPLRS